MSVEFEPWPNTARLFRDVTITEKLDGTNACVIFKHVPEGGVEGDPITVFDNKEGVYAVYAQSRNRLITPSADNAGFARYVKTFAPELFHVLGEGRHYGEWWGHRIGRKYDMPVRVFSTFNTAAWYKTGPDGLDSRATRAREMRDGFGLEVSVVPVLFQGVFSEEVVRDYADQLRLHGSFATNPYTGENFLDPEGICIYHKQMDRVFKYTFDGNDKHKWEIDIPEAPKTTGAFNRMMNKLRGK